MRERIYHIVDNLHNLAFWFYIISGISSAGYSIFSRLKADELSSRLTEVVASCPTYMRLVDCMGDLPEELAYMNHMAYASLGAALTLLGMASINRLFSK